MPDDLPVPVIPVTITIPRALVESCIDSGMTTISGREWLSETEAVGDFAPNDLTDAEIMCRGGRIKLTTFDQDNESEDAEAAHPAAEDAGADLKIPKEIDAAAITAGLEVLAVKYPHHFADLVKDNADAETGDALLQCAAFGEIEYV